MSVPVRYTAAANYVAVVDESGLSNTLQQEEQYHIQQQLEQQLIQQQQQQYPEEERLLYNQLFSDNFNNNNNNISLEQQQFMQQRLTMSSSVSLSPTSSATASPANIINTNSIIINNTNNNNNSINESNNNSGINMDTTSSQSSISSHNIEEASMMAAAAAATANNSGHEAADEWMMRESDDEGRYGTPGAAGLEYQKYELDQQQQQTTIATDDDVENDSDQPMESTPLDNENSNNNNTNTNSNVKNVEDEWISKSTDELYNILKEYDALQDKYHTVLLMPKESRREVTAGGRDGSAYVLRCLKMWYELPSDVIFSAMSLVDRFLDRMAVKPKHMACMSVASFHLAIKQLGLKPIPAEDLVTISQCGCTAGDLERMAGVIENKLGVQMSQVPVTSVSFLRIYFALFRNLAKEIGGQFFEFYKQYIKLEELENRLEALLCDVKTTVIAPSTLALVLISLHLDFHIKESSTKGKPELKHVFEYIIFLQQFMRVPDRVFTCGFSIVSGILSHYNGQNKQPYKQRLVWRLSSRTLRVLRPTNRFSSDLPTIEEGISNTMDDGCRSRTESISSEEEEDWPTSPIIPIFEQC